MARSSLVLGTFDLYDLDDSPVFLNTGWDRGLPPPTLSDVASTVLDGAPVIGLATGNRTSTLPVTVRAGDRVTLAGLVNQVLVQVNKATWQLQFTPAGGFTVVYDCFRASVAVASPIAQDERTITQSLVITFEALPFGRSPNPMTVPLAGSPVSLDAFDSTAPTVTMTTGTLTSATIVSTPTPFQGAGCLQIAFTPHVPFGSSNSQVDLTASRSSLSIASGALDLPTVKVWARQDAAGPATWGVTVTVTTTAGTYTGIATPALSTTSWTEVDVTLATAIPAGSTITGWSVEWDALTFTRLWHSTKLFLDDLILFPAASSSVSDSQGIVLNLNGVVGTARTPVALALTQVLGGTFKCWCVHTPPPDRPGQPMVPLASGGGGWFGTVPATVRYGGTYSVYVSSSSMASVGTARVVQVFFSQALPSGSPAVSISASITPTTAKDLYYIGSIALPLFDYPAEASTTTSVLAISANGSDVFDDILLLDTRGQTIIVGSDATAELNAFVDAPKPTHALGGVWSGPNADRSGASSLAGHLQVAAALLVNPGNSSLLAFSPEGELQGTATYYPRWLQEATQ